MTRICSLKMHISRERALAAFRPPGPVGLLRTWKSGPLRCVADSYLPFFLFRVRIDNAAQQRERFVALDGVRGTLDLYTLQSVPHPDEIEELETRNHVRPTLDPATAAAIVAERIRRVVFTTGFFKIRDLQILPEAVRLDLHIPYWVGFSGRGEAASIAVLDAIRGSLEGPKVRDLFMEWLLASGRTHAFTDH